MLQKSDTSISDVLGTLNGLDIDACLLVPTDTAMKKSIMDATSGVREYLSEKLFHHYSSQEQGEDHRVLKQAYYVLPDGLMETKASLYRPKTKQGDPRIWFYRLKRYAEPFNLLAVFVHDDTAYVINCSNSEVLNSLANPKAPFTKILEKLRPKESPAVKELLTMIEEISSRGFIPTMRPGDTGIGMTLETLLGIEANSRTAPDYRGIEIKAKRMRKGRPNRVTLFSQVPNWKLSPIGSAWNLLSTYGYVRDQKLRLNHEINATAPNSLGFMLELDTNKDWLKQNHVAVEAKTSTHVATWEMQKLRNRLAEKHPQTFWVGAKCRGKGKEEAFHYVQVEHTKQPSIRNFDALIEGGVISVDYLMSQKAPERVRDHGYLFKIHPSDIGALFPPPEIHLFE